MRLADIAFILWWTLCIAAIAALLIVGINSFDVRPRGIFWKVTDPSVNIAERASFTAIQIRQQLDNIVADYTSGQIATPSDLVVQVAELPFVQQAQLTQTTNGKTHLALTPFVPFLLLNDNEYINRLGKTKKLVGNSMYNALPKLYLPRQQLQQLFPYIHALTAIVASEGLSLNSIQITSSGIWTVTLGNGWIMIFGPQPNFTQLFEQLRLALPDILKQGSPLRFDFRYDAAIAVTYNS